MIQWKVIKGSGKHGTGWNTAKKRVALGQNWAEGNMDVLFFEGTPMSGFPVGFPLTPTPHQLTWKCANPLSKRKVGFSTEFCAPPC